MRRSSITISKERFKQYLQKIGSGEKTSQGMNREESAEALHLMLAGQASPAQIGAFMIAHRIRRPEPEELAGMLDKYKELGPKIYSPTTQRRPICFGMPFDGRTKTAPIYPLTALILLDCGQPVVLQGGKRMPTKYGITTNELFQSIGLDMKGLSITKVQQGFASNGFAFIYQPDHFPLAEALIEYREEIGKRPPIASLELIWTAHQGTHLLASGFVHPPTENRAWETLKLTKEDDILTIKGLEGSTDLPTGRPSIIAKIKKDKSTRIILHQQDYNCHCQDIKWSNIEYWQKEAINCLDNKGPMVNSLVWNAGCYLWLSENVDNIKEGMDRAKESLQSGSIQHTLNKLIKWRKNI